MRKMYLRGAARKTVAAMVLCALIFSTTGVSVYAEGDVDTEVKEEVDDSVEQPSENQNEEISKEPEVSGASEHQEDESTLTDKINSKEESDTVGESKDEILSTDNQKNQQEQVVGFELNKEDSALDPAMLEASFIENPNMQNLGCSLPEAPEEPEWSEWESNNNGTHSRHRTVIGENGEETAETETKDCEFVEEVVGDEIVLKCPDCKYVSERWSAKPEITDVSPDEGENNSVFYEPITVSANISCEDVRRSIAASENSTDEELFEAYINSYDVTLAIQKLESNDEIHIEPEVKLEGDTLTYTWKVPADENEKNIFYVIGGIVATNVKRNVTETHKLNYTVYISDPEEVIQKASFTVYGKDDFSYDADDMSQHWYSNKGDKTDNLKVRISSESYGNKVIKIDSFEEIKDGKAIHVYQSSSQPPRVYQVPYEKHFLWWTWTCYRDEVTYDLEYDLPTELDGVHEYLINYSADNVKCTKRLFTYIDSKKPVIKPISYNGSDKPTGSEGAEEGYYREAVTVVLKVEEDNLINPEKLEGITLENETTGDPIDFRRNSDNEFVATTKGDGVYRISGKELDKAGNENEDFERTSFTVDTKVPEVEVKFDNDNVKNEKYFNASRTATITVKDTNFGAEDKLESLTINAKSGSPKNGAWEGSGDSYSKKITFDEDGIYDLTFSCKDKAGNSTETTTVKEFVIDTKKPEISVSYNNNNVKNEKYFNAARKATVTINDLSFSESLVKVEKTGDNALPSLDSFSGNENSNSASMTFDKDGKYSFKVTCEDLAGNVSDGFSSDEFIIDTVAPEVEITGVENMSANNGAVEPVINATDLNLVDTDISITVTGSNNGQVALNKVTSNIKDGFNYKLSDIPHEKANDDLYTLEAKIIDRAGNETNKKIQYSINRFGSVYVLGDATKKMVDGYYVTNPQDVVITEINVDPLSYKEVSIAHDGNVKELREGKGYKTSDVTNDKGWHSISYDVVSSNFAKDGNYAVTVFSEDKATNKQSNQSKDAEVEFLVDTTAPSVVVSGIESDGVYTESEHDFSINATDTIGLADLNVYLNDTKLAAFTGKELSENGGTEIVTIPGKEDYQQIYVVCTDVAGNETKLSYNNVLISENALELEKEGEIEKMLIDPDPVIVHGEKADVPKAVAAVAGIGAAGAGGAFGFRRFRLKK